jgi:hypothetical protein
LRRSREDKDGRGDPRNIPIRLRQMDEGTCDGHKKHPLATAVAVVVVIDAV